MRFEGSSSSSVARFLVALGSSAFVKNVAVVMSGSAIAQIIGFALTPIISRLFSPSDFGIFGSFTTVVGIIGTFVTLQYAQAIILSKRDVDAINVLSVSCLCTILISGLGLMVCLLAPNLINGLLKTEGVWALGLLVVALVVSGLNQTFQAWCVRAKAFKHTSASQVIRSVSSSGSQIGLGSMGFGVIGLVFSRILSDLLASVNLGRVVLRDWRLLRENVGWKGMREQAREYRDFPMYSASLELINSLSIGLPIFLLAYYYGVGVAGAYAFAVKVLSAPMGFVTTALRQVLSQKAAEADHERQPLLPLFAKITVGLFIAGIVPALILVVLAPQIFSWLFGLQWEEAGKLASGLIVWLLFMFCNVPAVVFGRVIRIQKQMFVFDLALLLLRSASLYFGGLYLSAASTVWLYSIAGGGMNVVFIAMVAIKIWKYEASRDQKEVPE